MSENFVLANVFLIFKLRANFPKTVDWVVGESVTKPFYWQTKDYDYSKKLNFKNQNTFVSS
jgi:hypothetical protein